MVQVFESKEFVLDETITHSVLPYQNQFRLIDKNVVRNEVNGKIYHLNYLEYLHDCWSNHYNAVLKPDFIWYTVLCEIASHIKGNVEYYRHLFTDSQEKKEIKVLTNDPVLLPLDDVVTQLILNIPSKLQGFFPSFSTTTPSSAFAFNAAFCDAMSPYYNYMMFMCGIPKIRIDGNEKDWLNLISSFNSLKSVLDKLESYFSKITNRVEQIIMSLNDNDGELFKSIITLTRCGSGHQHNVSGWFTEFYVDTVEVPFVENFPSHVSVVEYKFLGVETKEYLMKVGLFSSDFSETYLEPDFGYLIYNK